MSDDANIMPPLSSEQEEKVTLFREVTQAAEPRARQYLEMSNWNVEQAINLHMTGALDNMAAAADNGGGPTAGHDFIGGINDTLMGNGAGAAGFIGPVAPNGSGVRLIFKTEIFLTSPSPPPPLVRWTGSWGRCGGSQSQTFPCEEPNFSKIINDVEDEQT